MKLKLYSISTLMFVLLSCNQSDQKSLKNSTAGESKIPSEQTTVVNNENSYETKNCGFDDFLNNPQTPKLAKDLFLNQAKNPLDNEAITYFDKFLSKQKQEREFYFKAITNSCKIADGAYAEALGYSGREFIENHPKQFVAFFDNKNCFSENDLEAWADILVLEFAIESEDQNPSIMDSFIQQLKMKCTDCSSTQKETIQKLGFHLNKKWKEYLENTK